MIIKYPCNIDQDKDSHDFIVSFPNFDEALTSGRSIEESLFNASEVLTLTLEGRIDEKIYIPEPCTKKRYKHWVAPSVRVQAALLVRLGRNGRTLSDLARVLETSWPVASKLENPHHWTTLKQLDKVASVFGKRLVLSMEDISQQNKTPN